MYETINAEVSDLLDGSLIRMAETYSVWLYATIKVSMVILTVMVGISTGMKNVKYNEV